MITVLVVDDDVVARMLLRHMLERDGCSVVETQNLAGARAVICHERVDLAVIDLNLGDENGLDLVPELTADDVRCVLLTGSRNDSRLEDPRMGMVSARLAKPVSSDELGALITALTVA